ncbi:helix-turn-helix domain-containing protein [Pantoea sp. BAV 3049]|uniref:helix-turn-helix domain-containing protein n=1 Tax=Pantoea sp. BAV 3049 TaxID=2654188 RepID=UPI00131AB37D|nr:helix-turn-helix domain-containing protein [Pantoea sp. BAV 3049]
MKITSPRQLSIYLKDLRKSQKISQRSVASHVVIRQDTLSKFELNPDTTKIETLFMILSAMNLELHLEHKNERNRAEEWKEEW